MKSTAKLFNYISLGLNLVGFLLHFIIGIVVLASGGKALKNLGITNGWLLILIGLFLLVAALWNLFSNWLLNYTRRKDAIAIINGIVSILCGYIVTGVIILTLKDEDYGYCQLKAMPPKSSNKNNEINKEKK